MHPPTTALALLSLLLSIASAAKVGAPCAVDFLPECEDGQNKVVREKERKKETIPSPKI